MVGILPLKSLSFNSTKNEIAIKSAWAEESIASENPQSDTSRNDKNSSLKTTEEEQDFFIDEYDDPAEKPEKKSIFESATGAVLTVLKYAFSLAFVLVLGYLSIRGLKLFMSKNNALLKNEKELINILELKYLAPNKALCLIELGGKVFLLGVGGNNINLLSEITEPKEILDIKSPAKTNVTNPPFQNYLKKFTKNLNMPYKTSSEKTKNKVESTTESIGKKLADFKSFLGERK